MNNNFNEIIPRRGTNSYKWDSSPDKDMLPLWVADMDFKTAPAIIRALNRRVEHGIFGYVKVPDAYYEAVINWFRRKHHWTMQKEWIIYTSGVVPALSAIIKAMTQPGDKVLVQTPVYNCFFSSIRNNGCDVVCNELLYHDRTYTINYADLEEKTSDPAVKVMLLCNPHNPVGRVWTPEELRRIGEICIRNNVFIVADEIHCELVYPGHTYTPFASLSEEFLLHSGTCTSPSKSFNLAGLQIANITIADAAIRQRVDKAININEVCDVNPFGVEALIAAYNESEEWLGELLNYLQENYRYLCDFFSEHLPQFPVIKLEGTYLVWVDCSVLNKSSEAIATELLNTRKVWINEGTMYGNSGEQFIRINIACPKELLKEALKRIEETLNAKGAANSNQQ